MPLVGAAAQSQRDRDREPRPETDAAGRFEVAGVPPGEVSRQGETREEAFELMDAAWELGLRRFEKGLGHRRHLRMNVHSHMTERILSVKMRQA